MLDTKTTAHKTQVISLQHILEERAKTLLHYSTTL